MQENNSLRACSHGDLFGRKSASTVGGAREGDHGSGSTSSEALFQFDKCFI